MAGYSLARSLDHLPPRFHRPRTLLLHRFFSFSFTLSLSLGESAVSVTIVSCNRAKPSTPQITNRVDLRKRVASHSLPGKNRSTFLSGSTSTPHCPRLAYVTREPALVSLEIRARVRAATRMRARLPISRCAEIGF